jgi:hypothetical protein
MLMHVLKKPLMRIKIKYTAYSLVQQLLMFKVIFAAGVSVSS